MNKEEIKKIAEQVYRDMASSNQFRPSSVPYHVHNGTDSQRINLKDTVPNNKYVAIAVASSGQVTFNAISNPSSLMFYGFAANNAGGGAATLKAMVTGNAQLGVCYSANSQQSTSIVNVNASSQSSYIQTSCGVYIDTTDLTKTRVFASGTGTDSTINKFIYVTDGTTVVASATVVSWDSVSITISVTLAAGWQITGGFLII